MTDAMTATSPKAFMLSATLHATVIALLLLFGFVINRDVTETPKVFELVAGEGDNYAAREAPALGVPGGVKLDIPAAPEPRPAPPQPAPEPVSPVVPAPLPPTPKVVTPAPKPTEQPVPNFKRQLQREVIRAESKAKKEIKKARDAEAKKAAEEAKRMSKEEFDKLNKAKSAPTGKSSPTKVAKIDAEGIAKGVVGGSTANKIGGAGGKALKNDNDDVLAAYDALFKQRLRKEFEPPPGLSDSLKVTMEVRSNADGSLANARVVTPSGSAEFDRAVLDAIRRLRMPARPDRKAEVIEFIFTMRERTEG